MKRLLEISIAVLIMLLFYSAAYAYKLPDTGQTKCYQAVSPFGEIPCAGTGQDGEYIINPISYTDNGNGTVTDNNTGLMWQKCTVGQNNDTACSGTATTYTWDSAQTACDGLTLGSKSDWRAPSKKEFISIVDYDVPFPGPTIREAYFPNTIAGSTSVYWTSTERAGDSTKAWYTTFDYGSVYYQSKGTGYYVRCVRGDATARSFTPNGDGMTVTDNRTGLIWQKCAVGQNNNTCSGTATTYTWDGALSYCNNLSLANQTDWRLPSAKELESLTDETKFYPSLDTQYFPNTNYTTYWWSSTTSAGSPPFIWYVSFGYGPVVSSGDKLSYLNVRCVRGGQNGAPNLLVRLMNPVNPVNTYSTLHDAYADAYGSYIIQAQATDFTEALTLADNKAVTLKGGYDSDFSLNLSMTTLYGSLTITGGTLTVENLMIE